MVTPKIEDLKIDKLATAPVVNSSLKKNPFLVSKKKTIRRTPSEVADDRIVSSGAGGRRGLNKPQLIDPTPLDKEFLLWESVLEGTLDTLSIQTLSDRFAMQRKTEIPSSDTRYLVILHILEGLERVQNLSNKVKHADKNLLKISLHDMKTFSKMINAVVVLGIYPALKPFGIGISLEKRQLNKETQKRMNIYESYGSTDSMVKCERLLAMIYGKLFSIMKVKSDVADLLSRGTGFSDLLTVAVALISVPEFDANRKDQIEAEFDTSLCTIADTYELFQTFNLLLMSESPQYYKTFVMSKLQLLPSKAPRGDGVLTLIEFVLGLRDHEEINIEKFEQVANVILLKPRSICTVDYFNSIGQQLYDLLININKPTVTSCVSFILEKLWSKNPLVTRDFFLVKVWDGLSPPSNNVSEVSLNNNINVLISLTNKGLERTLMKALIEPILLPMWAYYKFVLQAEKPAEIPLRILVAYLATLDDVDATTSANCLAKNLMYDGGSSWVFATGINGLVEIVPRLSFPDSMSSKAASVSTFVKDLSKACSAMKKLLSDLDDDLTRKVFVAALNRWLSNSEHSLVSEEESSFFVLADLKLLESIGEDFNDILAESPKDILVIVENMLSIKATSEPPLVTEAVDSDDEEETDESFELEALSVVLKLLSTVLSEPSLGLDKESMKKLENIKTNLDALRSRQDVIAKEASSLHGRIEDLLSGDSPVQNGLDVERRIFKRAVASLDDPLVPIRAHGLYLLRQLIEANSDVVSLDFVFELHMIQLKDPDPFVYLNVIKGLDSLTTMDAHSVLTRLVQIYANTDSTIELEERLRVGEIILRFVNRQNKLFSGPLAALVVQATISVIRGSVDTSKQQEIRLRMSSMSLLGVCCRVNPLGLIDHLEDALDCAIGVLQLETSKDESIMRRAAVVLIHDLILGTSDTPILPFPAEYRPKVISILRYVQEFDHDPLVREQCNIALSTINDLVAAAADAYDEC